MYVGKSNTYCSMQTSAQKKRNDKRTETKDEKEKGQARLMFFFFFFWNIIIVYRRRGKRRRFVIIFFPPGSFSLAIYVFPDCFFRQFISLNAATGILIIILIKTPRHMNEQMS